MDKGTTVQQIFEATRLLKKNNIRPAFFLQFGYLGEEKTDIEKTINMVLELMPEELEYLSLIHCPAQNSLIK